MSPRTTEEVLHEQGYQQRSTTMSTTMLDQSFDIDNEEGSKFEVLPEGKYEAEIFNASIAPTKNGKGQAVSIVWQIVSGDYERRQVFQSVLLQHDSAEAQRIGRGMFKDICACCGLTGKLADLEQLFFKPCIITVKIARDKDGRYDDKNRVVRVHPIGALATPVQQRQADTKKLLAEASKVEPSFKADGKPFDDEIPF
jgi:hypothetical protein